MAEMQMFWQLRVLPCLYVLTEMERWRDGEMERWRDGKMDRWRDGEMDR
jgi:hypothetical protein